MPSERGGARHHRTTLNDIAQQTGLALSTVSRALARPGRVSAETAARVRDAAEQLGYQSRPVAPSSKVRHKLIAVVLTDVANPSFAELLDGARHAAFEGGNTLVIVDGEESAKSERWAISNVMPAVDGIVMATSRMNDNAIRMVAKQIPLVMLNRHVLGVPSLVINTEVGIREAVEHLQQLGHRRVLYVSGPEASWTNGARWRAVQDVAAELKLTAATTASFAPTERGGRAAADAIPTETTAVVCFNDLMAIGLMEELSVRGRTVPAELSVVGWDNIRGAEWVRPSLSTVASPQRALGTNGVRELVLFMSRGTPSFDKPVVLPSKFIARDSVARRR